MRRMPKLFVVCLLLLGLCGSLSAVGQLNEKDQALFDAIRSGNLAQVQEALANHANIEAKDEDGYTPLLIASSMRLIYFPNNIQLDTAHTAPELIKLLLNNHANPLARTNKGEDAMDLALANLSCTIVLALERGEQTKTQECLTALMAKHPHNAYEIAMQTAVAMNPRPVIPEDARKSYVQANVIYRNAQNNEDIKSALALYRDALDKAPWFSDASYNASLALEKLGDYYFAAQYMKNMLPLEAGGPNERRDLDRIYMLEAKAKMGR